MKVIQLQTHRRRKAIKSAADTDVRTTSSVVAELQPLRGGASPAASPAAPELMYAGMKSGRTDRWRLLQSSRASICCLNVHICSGSSFRSASRWPTDIKTSRRSPTAGFTLQ